MSGLDWSEMVQSEMVQTPPSTTVSPLSHGVSGHGGRSGRRVGEEPRGQAQHTGGALGGGHGVCAPGQCVDENGKFYIYVYFLGK